MTPCQRSVKISHVGRKSQCEPFGRSDRNQSRDRAQRVTYSTGFDEPILRANVKAFRSENSLGQGTVALIRRMQIIEEAERHCKRAFVQHA
jgi:hypothetical protein